MPDTNAPEAHPTASPTENPSAPDSLESHVKSISLERLIHGFPLYFKTAREIVLRPTSFVISLDIKNRDQLGGALEFVSYSIVICFVLLIPTFIAHNEKLSKFTFFARMLTQFAIYGVIVHLALKVVGSRTVRLRGTLAAYAYCVGLFTPIFLFLYYPQLLLFGPKVIFGTPADISEMSVVLTQHLVLVVYSDMVLFAIGIYGWVLFIKFFSSTHAISKFRAFLAMALAGGLMVIPQIWLINPVFNLVFAWVDKAVDFL